MKVYRYLILALLCALSVSCSKDNTLDNEEPQTVLSDIAGTWFQYAYLCSDGYFVDISDTGIAHIMNLPIPIYSHNTP